MSKHNQYYSDWDETPENEYDRDQAAYSYNAGEQDTSHWHTNTADLHDSPLYQNTHEPYVSSTTYLPGHDDSDRQYPTPHDSSDYYDRESDRGFNLVNIADFRHSDYDDDNSQHVEYYAEPQHRLPHDRQVLISDITNTNKSTGIQVVADDFVDSPMYPSGIRIPRAITLTGLVLFGLALTGWLLYSSQPELSAYDIVQMESYDGQQTTPAIFNLTDLKDCTSLSDCIKESLAASKADIAQHTRETSALRREIAAVNSAPVAATSTRGVTLERIPSQVVVVESLPDQLQVKKQWSIIRSAPSASAEIITSLRKGVNVRIITSTGSWYEIEAINSKATRGYMHKSTIGNF